MESPIPFTKSVRVSDDSLEVTMSVIDFQRLIHYVNDLKDAVEKLNAEIESYNKRFADVEKD